MGEFVVAGVLTWLLIFVTWGMNWILFRPDRRTKVIGGVLVVLALVPTAVALWLGT